MPSAGRCTPCGTLYHSQAWITRSPLCYTQCNPGSTTSTWSMRIHVTDTLVWTSGAAWRHPVLRLDPHPGVHLGWCQRDATGSSLWQWIGKISCCSSAAPRGVILSSSSTGTNGAAARPYPVVRPCRTHPSRTARDPLRPAWSILVRYRVHFLPLNGAAPAVIDRGRCLLACSAPMRRSCY